MTYELTGFEGRVAVVTGAGRMRGIGHAVAVELARAGCDVVITGTGRAPQDYPEDEKKAGWKDIESVAAEIEALGRRALPVVSDVADPAAAERLARRVEREFGRVDFLVNNAGSAKGPDRAPVTELDVDVWRRVVDVNLNGAFYMAHYLGRAMIAAGNGGCIINISTVGTKLMIPNAAAYGSSKLALHALSESMAGEVSEHGIRVNAVCPGMIDTSRMDDIPRGEVWDGAVDECIPLGRAGTGEDVAHACVFLCSEQGSWITGHALYVDGGHWLTPR